MTGKELIDGMEAAGMTCRELADKLGVSINTVLSWRSRPDQSQCCAYMAREVERVIRRRSVSRARSAAPRS